MVRYRLGAGADPLSPGQERNEHRPSFDRQRVTRAPEAQGRPETPEPLHLHDRERIALYPGRILQAYDPARGESEGNVSPAASPSTFVWVQARKRWPRYPCDPVLPWALGHPVNMSIH